jgi:hypothetical protein
MLGMTRGFATLVGAAVAGFLLWLAAQMGDDTAGGFWATYGLVAAAGLAMALSQLLGGWTKWGWPRLSMGVFLIGFLPAALVGLWVVLAAQPGDPFIDTASWSDDLGIGGVVSDLVEMVAAVAFGVGLILGFTFDTTGPRVDTLTWEPREDRERELEPLDEPTAADEPVTAERRTQRQTSGDADGTYHPRRVIRT